MANYTVSIPESINSFIGQQMRSGQYADISEYVCELIRKDRTQQAASTELKKLLDEAVSSGVSHKTMAEIRASARMKAGL